MGWLSLRLVRLALFASATSLYSYASDAIAQVPVHYPEPAPTAPDAQAHAAGDAPVAVAPAAAAPVAWSPAPAATSASELPPSDALAPAKADRITEPNARREAEVGIEDDGDDDQLEDAHAPAARWYGWETLVADGVDVAAFLGGVKLSSQRSGGDSTGSALAWFGLLGYELAPGFVHFVHRNPGRGFASFGLRLGLPLAGAFIGLALASGCNRSLCEASGGGAGILLGMGGAVAIDAAVLAYEDPKPAAGRGPRMMPLASVTPHQAWIGLGGEL